MIDLGVNNSCICKKYENTQNECINEFTIREQGKSVKLEPKNSSEKVLAIIIDKCVIKDNNPKCDALFLYQQGHILSFFELSLLVIHLLSKFQILYDNFPAKKIKKTE